jgi:hypothetical protein
MKMFNKFVAGWLLAGLCGSLAAGPGPGRAAAAPAPWFKWRSKLDGKQFCAQTSLGHGWEKASGPYQDSHCEKLLAAK